MAGTKRIPSTTLDEDRDALRAIADMGDYAPANTAYSLAALQELEAALAQAELDEIRARRALDMARDRAIGASRRFHDAIVGAKTQVVAQYGADSPAVMAVGLKRKSEHKRPARRRALAAD
jgi:hypothetical protein